MCTTDFLISLIEEARNITTTTNQKEICCLLGKVAETKMWHVCNSNFLGKLQTSLSTALSGKLNQTEEWERQLKRELDELEQILKNPG